jgi:hypothetical protein
MLGLEEPAKDQMDAPQGRALGLIVLFVFLLTVLLFHSPPRVPRLLPRCAIIGHWHSTRGSGSASAERHHQQQHSDLLHLARISPFIT